MVAQLKSGELKHAITEPDREVNFPRVWFIWKGNAIGTSAKGHEYFLDHYLGTTKSNLSPGMITRPGDAAYLLQTSGD